MNLEAANITALFATIATRVAQRVELPEGTPALTFAHGSYDAVKALVERKEAGITDRTSFPLIWLVTPIEQGLATGDGICDLSDVQLLILQTTDPNLSEDAQVSQVMVPVLRPIYLELLRQIDASYFFSVLSAEAIQHRMKEWTYKSVGEGGNNLFDKSLCAIQVRGMRLTVNESVASDFKLSTL